jgi:Na+/proline symporter
MNPLRWERAHQIGALIGCLLGALAGLCIAWVRSPFRWLAEQGDYVGTFSFWLEDGRFWPWPVLGAIIAAMMTYVLLSLRHKASRP